MIARIAILSFVLVAIVSVASAQEGPPLTQESIGGFIASMADLEAWGDAHERDVEALEGIWERESAGADFTNPFAMASEIIESQPWADEVIEIIQNHGFDDLESWARTGNRIFSAFMAVQMDANREEMEAGMAEAMKQIESSDMTEEQKEGMRRMLRGSGEMAQYLQSVPEADKKAVAPFLDDLQNMGSQQAQDN